LLLGGRLSCFVRDTFIHDCGEERKQWRDEAINEREGVGKESNRYGAGAVHAAVRQSIPARLFLKLAKNVEIFGGKYLKGTVTNMAGDPKTNTEF
jgi:hypothetical protein